MIEHVVKKIKEADLVLVGLGEELDALAKVRQDQGYQETAKRIENPWMLPYIEKIKLDELTQEKSKLYRLLGECLENKNYFIVSLCQDGLIRKAGLNENRIVEPCGGYEKLQCSEKCNTKLYNVSREFEEKIKTYLADGRKNEEIEEPICPLCGKPLVFNCVDSPNYVEEGYLNQWMTYKKWLMGTVNKNICLLEIGVGMKYPTVIRWPYEKITFFNEKAELFRVHSRLYQITEEIKKRAYGICQKPEDFIRELFNAF